MKMKKTILLLKSVSFMMLRRILIYLALYLINDMPDRANTATGTDKRDMTAGTDKNITVATRITLQQGLTRTTFQ